MHTKSRTLQRELAIEVTGLTDPLRLMISNCPYIYWNGANSLSSLSQVWWLDRENKREPATFHIYLFSKAWFMSTPFGQVIFCFHTNGASSSREHQHLVCIRSIPKRDRENNKTALILKSDFSMTKELDHENSRAYWYSKPIIPPSLAVSAFVMRAFW